MKKQKLPLILLLVLVIFMIATLAACNPSTRRSGGNGSSIIDVPVVPTPDEQTENERYLGSQDAWSILKLAALNASAQGKDANFLNFDTAINFGFAKDTYNAQYVLRIAGSIYTDFDKTQSGKDPSTILFELTRTSKNVLPNGEEQLIYDDEPVMSLYYLDEQIILDISGIKKGAHVVKTSDIDLAALITKLDGIVDKIGISDLLWDKVFTMNIGELIKKLAGMDIVNVSLEDLIVNFLFGSNKSRFIDYGEGHTQLQIPCDLSLIASILPLVQSLIPEDIFDLVDRVLGIDLQKIGALSGMALYLQADIYDDKLAGIDADIDVNLNSFGKEEIIKKYGIFQNEIGINLGYTKFDFAGTSDVNVREVVNTKYQSGLDNIKDYSILTFEGKMTINVNAIDKTVKIDNIIGSFGTLISGLLEQYLDADLLASLAPLFQKNVDFHKGTFTFGLSLQGTINTRDNSKTNIALELVSEDNTTALGVYYVGEMNALYIDASHLLTGVPDGNGGYSGAKVKITQWEGKPLNLNEIVDGLFDKVGDIIVNAINNIDIFKKEDQQTLQNVKAVVDGVLEDRTLLIPHNGFTSADDEQTVDTMTLINMILDCIDINMDGNIFNITEINVQITQAVLSAILGLVLKGDNAGIKIPVTNIDLHYANQGVGKIKTLGLNIGLGVDVEAPPVSLDLSGRLQLGQLTDSDSFMGKINDVIASDNQYITILEDGTLDISKFNISLSTGLAIDLSTIQGNLGEINIALDQLGLADDLLSGMSAQILMALGTIQGGLNINLDASIDLSMGLSLDTLLNSQIKLTITKAPKYYDKTSVPVPAGYADTYYSLSSTGQYVEDVNGKYWKEEKQLLSVCLADGYIYLDLSVLFVGVEKVKVKVEDIMSLFAKDEEPAASAAEALASDEEGGLLGDISVDDLSGLIGLVIGDIKVTDGFIEIAIASGIIDNIMDMLGINGIDIKFYEEDEGATDTTGGIRLAVPDTLNLDDLQVEVWLAVGKNLDLTVALNGFKAGIVERDLSPADKDQYTNIFEAPYASIDLRLGFDFYGDEGETDFELGTNAEDIVVVPFTFNDPMSFEYKLRVAGDLDLTPIIDYLFGAPSINTKDNSSELLIEITGSKFGRQEEVLLGLYYTGGTPYIDGANFGITRVSTDIDLYELILNLIMSDVNVKINDVGGSTVADALVSGDDEESSGAREKIAFAVMALLASDRMKVEVTKGITEAIFQVFGVDTNNAVAYLSYVWDNYQEHEYNSAQQQFPHGDEMFSFTGAIYNENNQYIGAATIYASHETSIKVKNQLNGLTIAHPVYDPTTHQPIDKVYTLAEYVHASNIHGGFDEVTLFNDSKDIVLPSVFLELKGTISLDASAGNEEWTIGEWIENFLCDTDFVKLDEDTGLYSEVYKYAGNGNYKVLSAQERDGYTGDKYVKVYAEGGTIAFNKVDDRDSLTSSSNIFVKVGDTYRRAILSEVPQNETIYEQDALTSFIADLLLQYNIPSDIAREFGFRIAVKLRLNPEVPINLTANIIYAELDDDNPAYTEVYKLVKNEYKLLEGEERTSYQGKKYVKQYLPDGIPLKAIGSRTELEGVDKVYVKVGDNFIKVDPSKV
ncbi:MAG: hypothetical protein II867_00775, partial [Clostridia bacterium]|nr:hypothetical protein [Clostridia bacterium]